MKKELVVALIWWAVTTLISIACIVWAMIFGWGLWPKSWLQIVLAYVALQLSWPFTIWCRLKFLKCHMPSPVRNIDMPCRCQRCGREYRVDLMIPDELWDEIKPREKATGAGLLCGACIMARIECVSGYDAWKLVKV